MKKFILYIILVTIGLSQDVIRLETEPTIILEDLNTQDLTNIKFNWYTPEYGIKNLESTSDSFSLHTTDEQFNLYIGTDVAEKPFWVICPLDSIVYKKISAGFWSGDSF